MNQVMVTGGAGFIGSHLCEELINRGCHVICVDNLQRGCERNIEALTGNRDFCFIKADACDQECLENIIKENRIDYVFHMAANTDLWESMNNPELEHTSTFLTTKTVLNAMREQKVKDLFFASTSAVYGLQTGEGFCENDQLFPISYYGAAKMAGEAYIRAFAHMNDMNVLVYRFSNVIGGKLTHGVIHDFIRRLSQDPSHLDVRGNGYQTKPYLYVSDLINAIMLMAGKAKGVETYNVGATTCTNVRYIATEVVRCMGLDGIPILYDEHNASWKGDVMCYEFKVDRIAKKGWHATINSDMAVQKTVAELVKEVRRE